MTPALIAFGLGSLVLWSYQRSTARQHTREQLRADPVLRGQLAILPGAIFFLAMFAIVLVVFVAKWVADGTAPF